MAVRLSTLCYIERDGQYLMLHRTVKERDINKDKWIGVGGHFEEGESPEECLLREVREETGYRLTSYAYRGIVTFLSGSGEIEYMSLFTADGFDGESIPCDEGELAWLDKEEVWNLNIWEGDKIFFRLLEEGAPFFSLKLVYDGAGGLVEAALNGREMELLDVLNPDGEKSGKVTERGVAHRKGAYHATAHVWIARERKGGGFDLLLQKRSRIKDSFPGCYDISAAGHIPAGADALSAALRELEEELGIQADEGRLEYVGDCESEFRGNFHGKPFFNHERSRVYLYREPVDISRLKLQESEVESVRWMEASACRKGVQNMEFSNCIDERELSMLLAYLEEKGGTKHD